MLSSSGLTVCSCISKFNGGSLSSRFIGTAGLVDPLSFIGKRGRSCLPLRAGEADGVFSTGVSLRPIISRGFSGVDLVSFTETYLSKRYKTNGKTPKPINVNKTRTVATRTVPQNVGRWV